MAYIENKKIKWEDVLAVLPIKQAENIKSVVLLADGQAVRTHLSPVTLKKRLDATAKIRSVSPEKK